MNIENPRGSRRGVGDKPTSCKPGVAGSIPDFRWAFGCSRPKLILNQPGGTDLYPRKPQKKFWGRRFDMRGSRNFHQGGPGQSD